MTDKIDKIIIPPDRPAFHVDDKLREAARRAKRAFAEEEKILKRSLMNQWPEEHANTN